MNLRLTTIKKRWAEDRKISAADVKYLLDEADAAETMRAADRLKSHAQRYGNTPESVVDALFGKTR